MIAAALHKSTVHPEPLLYLCWGVYLLLRAQGVELEPPSSEWVAEAALIAKAEQPGGGKPGSVTTSAPAGMSFLAPPGMPEGFLDG